MMMIHVMRDAACHAHAPLLMRAQSKRRHEVRMRECAVIAAYAAKRDMSAQER